MKRFLLVLFAASLTVSTVSPAFAIKPLNDQFKALYAGDKADEDYKKLVGEAKCNVCHVNKEKKTVRNPYGKALHEVMEKMEFPFEEYKKSKEKEKYTEQLEAIFKKVSEEKSGDEEHKTFADRIKAKLLPGGNKEGKKDE